MQLEKLKEIVLLNEDNVRVLLAIEKHPNGVQPKDLYQELGMDQTTFARHCMTLREMGLVFAQRNGRMYFPFQPKINLIRQVAAAYNNSHYLVDGEGQTVWQIPVPYNNAVKLAAHKGWYIKKI